MSHLPTLASTSYSTAKTSNIDMIVDLRTAKPSNAYSSDYHEGNNGSSFCTVCANFDYASAEQFLEMQLQAEHEEYDVFTNPAHQAAIISTKWQRIEKSAHGGCMFCMLLHASVNAFPELFDVTCNTTVSFVFHAGRTMLIGVDTESVDVEGYSGIEVFARNSRWHLASISMSIETSY